MRRKKNPKTTKEWISRLPTTKAAVLGFNSNKQTEAGVRTTLHYTESSFISKKHKRATRKLRTSNYLQIQYLQCALFWVLADLMYLMWNYTHTHAHTRAHKHVKKTHIPKSHIYEHKKNENKHPKVRFQAFISPKHTYVPFLVPHSFPIHGPWPTPSFPLFFLFWILLQVVF